MDLTNTQHIDVANYTQNMVGTNFAYKTDVTIKTQTMDVTKYTQNMAVTNFTYKMDVTIKTQTMDVAPKHSH